MYNRYFVILFQLAGNQKDGNAVPPSISGEAMDIDQHVSQMKHIYQLILAKAHSNIKKSLVS